MIKHTDINFTEDRIIRNLILFAIPIIISELLQTMYNSVDSLVVGNFVSDAALAAVSVCTPITNLLVGFFNGMSLGNTVVVARSYGTGNEEKTRQAIRYAFTFSVALGVFVSILSILLAPVLLHISGANEEIYKEAIVYLRIYLAGVMFMVIYNCGTGILRAIGDSQSPLNILAVTSVINIVLDLLFVGAFAWGTAGVGIATIIAQGISVVLIYYQIRHRSGVHCIAFGETWRDGRGTILSSLNVGFAAGLQSAMISFSNIFVWSYINSFPTPVVAGIGAATKVDRFVMLPCKSLAMTTTTFVSQNIGAQKYKRARNGIWYGMGLSAAVTAVLGVLLYLFAEPVIRCFNQNPDVIVAGAGLSRFLAPLYMVMVVREVLLGYLRGYGRSKTSMILTLIGMIGVRQLYLAWAMTKYGTVQVIYASFPIGWASAMVLLMIYTAIVAKDMWRDVEEKDQNNDGAA